jgi:hypothetical protein
VISFLDGPAAGQTLALRSAPPFLRVVEKRTLVDSEWDALDQPGDVAHEDELVHVYRRVGEASWAFLDFRPSRGRSGRYAIAEYEHMPIATERLRDNGPWSVWLAQMGAA